MVDGGAYDVVATSDGKCLSSIISGFHQSVSAEQTHHSMTCKLRVRLEDAVCGRVIPSSIHGIRAGLVKRRREPDVPRPPASDRDLGHCGTKTPRLGVFEKCVGENGVEWEICQQTICRFQSETIAK